ncbi:MAG: hypothetical protein HY741_10085 [Chloroflexi bacterium]|nr:hypothetical protein [Chloroflexota bacterium]
MDAPRVFLICVNRLVCEAMNILLRREGIEVVAVELNPEQALEKARAFHPNIILLESADDATDLEIALGRLVHENRGLRLISLNSRKNEISIYCRQQRPITRTQDLFEAICHD